MLIVSGKLYVEPGTRDGYLAGCLDVVKQAREAPGCLDFVLAADPLEDDRINVYERWESDEHLHRFRDTGPEPGQVAAIRDAHVAKYRISSTEAP
ncbi:antibiotic biosynthesis monooxygenase [Sphaerisporangium sp. TRM90804]|uniref:putative quinol monooxygenase n=1 Tax=Sphaerisporangium sp. TRM90804 TaxID=3031113 RepID=UPI00244B9EFB|nr:antibiotic biosynthesis monooxygenase [Sphaerisporangium sp. TRM90804]MDH2428514.1 antibiotic biosynthesis monooxygenase [Sphaerisporangium sp. TRM90804]